MGKPSQGSLHHSPWAARSVEQRFYVAIQLVFVQEPIPLPDEFSAGLEKVL
jgi:hypothetical protein